jgi:hypothetical protein
MSNFRKQIDHEWSKNSSDYEALMLLAVHGEFVNHAMIGIWNRPRQWCRQA